MALPKLEIPFTEWQREALNFGFLTLKDALMEENNPFPAAVRVLLLENELEKIHNLIDKCQNKDGQFSLFLEPTEMTTFFISIMLTKHVFLSDYFMEYLKEGGVDVDLEKKNVKNIKETIHSLMEQLADFLKGWEAVDDLVTFVASMPSLPDLMTGVSPKMAVYNHIPKIPDNPPQFDFRDYDDNLGFTYNVRANPYEFMKDVGCLTSFFLILNDAENPPAKVLTAYFPNLKKYIREVLDKIIIKDRRRKYVDLTAGEYGVLYACTDLFGRLRASSYHNLVRKLEKGTMFENFSDDIENKFPKENDKSFFMNTVERSLQISNEHFSDSPIIEAYRTFAAQMTSFDD